MDQTTSGPTTLTARFLADRSGSKREALVRSIVDRLVVEVNFYRHLPPDLLTGDVAAAVRENLAIFEATLSGRAPDERRLRKLATSAAGRADEGVPLDAVLAAYTVGVEEIWDQVTTGAAPADVADAVRAGELMLRHLRLVLETVVRSYLPEQLRLSAQEQQAEGALLNALLQGRAPDPDAARHLPVPDAYLVAAVSLQRPRRAEADPDRERITARRDARRVMASLRRWSMDGVLLDITGEGGTALLPVTRAPNGEADEAQPVARLQALLQAAAAGSDVDVHAAVRTAAPSGVPGAWTEVREVLEVVVATGRPPSVYRLSDVLLEVQLSRPGPAQAGLLALLAPLDDAPDLLLTLAAFLDSGLNRRRTAETLHVHRNTLLYRLRRITALTGLDTDDPADLLHLKSAVLARRITSGGHPRSPGSH